MLETLPLAASTYNKLATPPREEPITLDERTDTSTGTHPLPNRNQSVAARPEILTTDSDRPTFPTTVIAVDAGGTSTRAVWLDASGACLGRGRAAGGNPVSRGVEVAAAQVAEAVAQAAGALRRFPASTAPGVAVLAMAGAGSADHAVLQAALAGIGFFGRLVLASDLLAGFLSGSTEPNGYGIVAGTGAAAIRVVNGVDVAVADGVGWLLGDRGSGFWIGHRAVDITMRALDRSVPLSPLVRAVLAANNVASESHQLVGGRHAAVLPLVQTLYRAAPVDLAKLAPTVIRLAADGDEEAAGIVRDAVTELLRSFESVVDPKMPGPVVISGGVGLALPGLPTALEQVQQRHGWVADVRRASDGLFGAARLALFESGNPVSDLMLSRVKAGLDAPISEAVIGSPRDG